MAKRRLARIDRTWLPNVRYAFIQWADDDTDIVDAETGCVVYTTPTTARGLERAVAFARRHYLTIRKITIHRRDDEARLQDLALRHEFDALHAF